MNTPIILICPLEVWISSRTKFIVNLNNYRNTQHMALNKAKIAFKLAVMDQIQRMPRFKKVMVEFTLFPGSRRRMDTTNVCCIVDKFLMDAIVEYRKLPDDDMKHHVGSNYRAGEVDKNHPRVEAEIIEVV